MDKLSEHIGFEFPVMDCDCQRCAVFERDRLLDILIRIADHHEEQRRLWKDEGKDIDNALYHDERRNFVLLGITGNTKHI